MFGLEAGECNPFPGTGRRAAKRTGQLLDATSRVAASYALIAPGCHWSVPALEGIPTEYRFLGGLDAAARLGKALLASQLGDRITLEDGRTVKIVKIE